MAVKPPAISNNTYHPHKKIYFPHYIPPSLQPPPSPSPKLSAKRQHMPSLDRKLAAPYLPRPSSPPPSYSASAPPAFYKELHQGEDTRSSSASSTPKLSTDSSIPPASAVSALHPQVAVILGVKQRWHIPLQLCRCFSMAPAILWGVRSLWIFVEIVLLFEHSDDGLRLRVPAPGPWDIARRIRATEIFLAAVWCAASAYLSFFFADCLMSRWLLLYDAKATIIRLSTISVVNIYLSNRLMQLCNIAADPSRLLPTWIVITITLTVLYHLTQRNTNIKRETSAARRAFWFAMEITLFVLLVQLHFPFHLVFGR